jgi:hypothetical protein
MAARLLTDRSDTQPGLRKEKIMSLILEGVIQIT